MKKERVGEFYIGGSALLWGLFPVLTAISVAALSPLTSLAWATFFSALFFGIVLTLRRKWHEIANRHALPFILIGTAVNGLLFYLLTFVGLKYTNPGNVAIIALSEVFFSYLFFNVWRKEVFPRAQVGGALLMLMGALIVLYPDIRAFQVGDLFIIVAAAIAPLGNFFQRRARNIVSSEAVMFIRASIVSVIVFVLAIAVGEHPFLVSGTQTFMILALNGIFLLGLSKIFWFEGFHRTSITKANALSSFSPALTLLFAFFILHTIPTFWQVAAFIPMFFGVVLLTKSVKTKSPS